MSRNYDNWERLVAAVIKRQQIWELCHQQSRTPSTCSEASSSDFSSLATEIQSHEAEWIEQCNPGVYITLVDLQDGTRDLKRVRFSRRLFGEHQAETWWSDNKAKIYEKYNVQPVSDKSSVAGLQAAQRSDEALPSKASSSDFSSLTTEIQTEAQWTEQYEPEVYKIVSMSRNYDNWERLVAAVIKREEDWQLCHQHSRTETSSSHFSSSSRLENNDESARKPLPKLFSLRGVLTSEMLGKGRFGTSFHTQLQRDHIQVSDREFLAWGNEPVMKKLASEVKVTEEEFKVAFGNCRHENVAAPRAYYFSTNENYIFNDYHSGGSLEAKLHGTDIPFLYWEQRLKIAIGAARGIAHIHGQCCGKLSHGNIKSSNIFINYHKYGCVSDFGLASVMKISQERSNLDYHASEYEFKNASHEGDVYSFGVLLLELLTGRSPMELQGSSKNLHIVAWARSIRPEHWSSKLFDRRVQGDKLFCDEVDMLGFLNARNIELGGYSGMDIMVLGSTISHHLESMELEREEMMQVALRCLAGLRQDRPKMIEVVFMLENIATLGNGRKATTP